MRRGFAILLVVATAAACAPDSVRRDPAFDGWTYRVGKECYPHSIGSVQVWDLMREAAFLDLTSRLYHRRIDAKEYVGYVNTFYPGDNRKALDCILSRLPR
jgi:hypothetical protein